MSSKKLILNGSKKRKRFYSRSSRMMSCLKRRSLSETLRWMISISWFSSNRRRSKSWRLSCSTRLERSKQHWSMPNLVFAKVLMEVCHHLLVWVRVRVLSWQMSMSPFYLQQNYRESTHLTSLLNRMNPSQLVKNRPQRKQEILWMNFKDLKMELALRKIATWLRNKWSVLKKTLIPCQDH